MDITADAFGAADFEQPAESYVAQGARQRQTARSEVLDSLLCKWHQWQSASVGKGFGSRSAVAGNYQTSRQYDDENGALDEAIDHQVMKQVDFQVSEMRDPHKAAIYVLARALTLGVMVFTSPRLPAHPDEREAIIKAARALLQARLIAAGVMQ